MAWYSGYLHPYQGFLWTWSNEKAHSGIDLPDSCGTAMTAILPGKVITAGQYPCYGGQVSIASTFAGVPIVYTYLHGQSHNVNVGDTVKAGQLIGYSGQPVAAACGSGCHIHFEVEHGTQAPYTGGPPQNSSANNYPINPVPLLAYAATNQIPSAASLTNSGSPGSTSELTGTTTGQQGTSSPGFDWGSFLSGIGGFLANPASILSGQSSSNPITALEANISGLGEWVGNPIRIAKLIVGVALIGIALVVLILPTAAPLAAAGVTALAGAPEAAPAVAGAVSSVTHRRRKDEPRPVPNPISQAVPAAAVQVQRSYTTRRLGRTQAVGRATPSAPLAPSAPQAATPVATTTTNPQGKRTMRTPIVAPTSGPPAPGVQRMVPATGPSIPSNPPRSRKVAAKPTAAYTAPQPVQRAATTTPLRGATTTPLRAPTTAPLKGNQSPGTGYWMTPEEGQRSRAAGVQLFRSLKPGQSVVITPRSQRKQSQMTPRQLLELPKGSLSKGSQKRISDYLASQRSEKYDEMLRAFRQARDE